MQVIGPPAAVALPLKDLSRSVSGHPEAEAQRLAAQEAQRPFDLARGPLVRTVLVRLGDEEHLFLVAMHHIVSDGWSMGIFIREFVALYPALIAGRSSPLPELPIQYGDFAVWQRQWLQGEVLEKHLAYWQRQLHGAPAALQLPTDRPRPALETFRGAAQFFTLTRP